MKNNYYNAIRGGFYFFIFCFFLNSSALAQNEERTVLNKEFENPPSSSRPRVWWHWMNGNISKDGIRKDLEWMHRVGVGGFQTFDAELTTPQIVKKRLAFMTPEWKAAIKLTAELADSLNLEMAIAGSPGWSESGGPWVSPQNGMKKYVWSEIIVNEGHFFSDALPNPPGTTGRFQDIPNHEENLGLVIKKPTLKKFYKDIAVVAYRIPSTQVSLKDLNPQVTSSGGYFTLEQLTDGNLEKTQLLPSDSSNGFAWIQYRFEQPQTIKALTVVGGGDKGPLGLYGEKAEVRSLQASDNGINFRQICYIPAGDVIQQTIVIPETTAKYFRVVFKNPEALPNFGAALGGEGKASKVPVGTEIGELILYPYTVIDRFEEKAGFAAYSKKHPLTKADDEEAIPLSNVIDLTNKMNEDGTLDWMPPAGKWKVIRFGYSLTGQENGPATEEATGLEVDKLDAQAVKDYFNNYLNQYKDATGGLMGEKGLQCVVTDSWEAGQGNWTENMLNEFLIRRGYSMLQWMPVLTGKIVGSAEESEKFLWDFRKTQSELVVENHYDQLTKILNERGMKLYSESHESGRAFIADGMAVKRSVTVPMSAIWMPGFTNKKNLTHHIADLRESASVAHIYGQNLVAAESFTTFGMIGNQAYAFSPETLKPVADLALANGLNRFIIHTSVHQPVDDKIPGISLGPFGQWFTRHETWAEQAKIWTDYLSRSSYLLQQGKFVADIVYLYGEDNNITNLFGKRLPDIPEGYNYDFINADALVNLLSYKDGQMVTPSGMRYQVLMIDSSAVKMSLPVLRKIAELVRQGAVIGGVKPEGTPSLADDQQEFQRLLNEVWNSGNRRVFESKTTAEVLTALSIQPDFQYKKSQEDTKLFYVHRKLSDQDIYWVNNRNDRSEKVEVTFRLSGKVPRIWHPETGQTEPATYSMSSGLTTVTLNMTPHDAVFVVFESKAVKTNFVIPNKTEDELTTIEGLWRVAFQPDRGAPVTATFDKLRSYTENKDKGIKYFSGTATYFKSFEVSKNYANKDGELWLDLGDVKNIAEVSINGKKLGIVWKRPFRVNITNVVKEGENTMEIKVTNLWKNRMIGDAQPDVSKKITYSSLPYFKSRSRLTPSGLLGPVKIISIK